MKITKLLFLISLPWFMGAQTTPQSLLVTRIYNITSSWAGECGPGALDNRSQYTRQNNYHSYAVMAGSGSYTVTLSYSDTSCTGPWTSFGSTGTVDQTTNPPIGFGNGYHAFIKIAVTGNASVTYSASKDYFMSTSLGSPVVPPPSPTAGSGAYTLVTPYNFTALTPTAPPSISPGTNAITMATVPLGVNGNDVGHNLWIAGTGTPEACLITGGTGRAGDKNGQIIVNCAGSHSAGYTVSSVGAGLPEAWTANSAVEFPLGRFTFHATVTPPANASVRGVGSGPYNSPGTTMEFDSPDSKMFNVINDNFAMRDVGLEQKSGVFALPGNYAIFLAGNGSAVSGARANWAIIQNVTMKRFYYGFYCPGSGGVVNLYNIFVDSTVSTGLVGMGSQGWWTNITVEFAGTKQTTPVAKVDQGHGIYLANCAAGSGCAPPPWLSGIQTFSNYGYGVYADSVAIFLSGGYSYLNNDRAGEVCCITGGVLSNFQAELGGTPASITGYPINPTAIGVEIDSGSSNMKITNGIVDLNQGIGILINNTPLVTMNGINFQSNGQGGVAGNKYGLKITGSGSTNGDHLTFVNDPVLVTGGSDGTKITNSYITGGTASIPSLQVTGNTNGVVLTGNDFASAGGGTIFQCDSGSTLSPGWNQMHGTIVNNCTQYESSLPIMLLAAAKAYTSVVSNSIPDATWTAVSFDTEVYNQNAVHSTVSNPSRFVAPLTGIYDLLGQVTFSPNASGTLRGVRWMRNGATLMCAGYGLFGAGISTTATASCPALLGAGEYVELQVYQDRGGALNMVGGTENSTWGSVTRRQ